ncbi:MULTISPECIES: HD-GYP domain-containing protein [unclassified Fusibacter]|uniref:HD-GYP domain-containing protein n=1 Tax=unclassified Fusibacter TaxID=2624464 RepID=UPI0010123612|nr:MULTISPECIES: HD-GYP domain-containing protein [unclassified Fusibacter]MCK8059498.1 HD-GYP domain-containing protein [Fusibacter sp. A2]NPE21038.1 HD-GYP domain-containing protein [Fusibacter sp. A1]RXV62312.1 HD-GYP domain-containing protein [Fusibacter sp. A1]
MENVISKEVNRLIDYKFSLLVNSFVNTNHLSKTDFINHSFDTVFDLIDEAQKGSYYELIGDHYVPIASKGYDLNLLNQLKFTKYDAFIDYKSPDNQLIDAYEIKVTKRDDARFSKEMLDIFKALGTYENYISLYAPIKLSSEKIGVICLENFSGVPFTEQSKMLLKLFAQQFSNIYTLKHYQEQSDIRYQNITNVLVNAIEVKDSYTVGHANRVQELSLKIASKIKLSDERINVLKNAAILHDVGKIGIPTEVLIKPAKLTDQEYKTIQEHPLHAQKILSGIDGFAEIAELAYCHHEHYDGTGYPRGLKNEQIPFEAQIIQIADVFDAMTSERAYRQAFSVEKALAVLIEEKGRQFHPELVDIMIELNQDER